uniref:Uncharacterized protein n=1 Tax=Timema genevievae TaxID=629358 RepID=A0A7R9K2P9_TIMGE|nr:unnamed protein product [Timema genevievae]
MGCNEGEWIELDQDIGVDVVVGCLGDAIADVVMDGVAGVVMDEIFGAVMDAVVGVVMDAVVGVVMDGVVGVVMDGILYTLVDGFVVLALVVLSSTAEDGEIEVRISVGVELHRGPHNTQGCLDDVSPSSNQNVRHEQFFTGEKTAAIDLADKKRKSHRDGKDGLVSPSPSVSREVKSSFVTIEVLESSSKTTHKNGKECSISQSPTVSREPQPSSVISRIFSASRNVINGRGKVSPGSQSPEIRPTTNGTGNESSVSRSPSVSRESQRSLSQSTAATENSNILDGDVLSPPKKTIRNTEYGLQTYEYGVLCRGLYASIMTCFKPGFKSDFDKASSSKIYYFKPPALLVLQ